MKEKKSENPREIKNSNSIKDKSKNNDNTQLVKSEEKSTSKLITKKDKIIMPTNFTLHILY